MNIKATEHRHYSNKDYRIASDLPNNRQVAERKDCVDILGESGEVINSSAGSNVDTNIRGDVFWTEGDEIQKWSEAEGEQSVAKGYRGFIPGPDGKLFALGFDREAARQTVELLDEKGNTGGKALLPEQFKITGAYTNQDQSRVLLGGWSEAYFDVYTRPATLFALEVSDEGALKMEAVRRDNLNALSVKDYQPIILEDGREGVVTQMELKLGSRSESHEGAWSLLGYGAAPGGRPVDPFGSDLPANTLSEQLSQLFSSNEKTGSSSPGVPVWSKMEPRNPDLVDVSPPPTCREVEPEKKLWHPSLALKAGSGGAGLAAGAALLAVGLGPVGLGVAAAGLLGSGLLTAFDKMRPDSIPAKTELVESKPRFMDPNLGSKLKQSLELNETVPTRLPTAEVTSADDKAVFEFKTGMVFTKQGPDDSPELHLYGPTGDEKPVSAKTFAYDAASGKLKLDDTTYDLKEGLISNSWVKIENGIIKPGDSPGVTYQGSGSFELEGRRYQNQMSLPIQPEIFSETVGFEKRHASGEIYTDSEVVIPGCESFRSVERLEIRQAPTVHEGESLAEPKSELLETGYRVTLKDGRVLQGNEESVVLNGKPMKGTKLLVNEDGITLRREKTARYKVAKQTNGFSSALFRNPAKYEYEWGNGSQVKEQNDLTIKADGRVILSKSERSDVYQSPMTVISETQARVGDPEIGDNFERVL